MARTKNSLVKKSNALIRTQWKVESVWEPRIVAHLASKIHIDDKDFTVYSIPITDVLGQNYGGENLKELGAVVKNMMARPLTIQESPTRVSYYNLFSRCTLDAGTGVLELRFDPDLKPHFLQLQANFTRYSLTEFLSLKSIYSQRLYEVLKSYSGQDYVELMLDDLYTTLDFPAALRKNFFHFRKKVLEQAHKEIVDGKLSLWFDWTPIKTGRGGKVSAIRFVFSDKEPKPEDDAELVRAKLLKQASSCYFQLMKRGVTCTPQPTKKAKCKICVAQVWHTKKHGETRQKELYETEETK